MKANLWFPIPPLSQIQELPVLFKVMRRKNLDYSGTYQVLFYVSHYHGQAVFQPFYKPISKIINAVGLYEKLL